jgi:hypothetical protein
MAVLLAAALAIPAGAQDRKPNKPAAKAAMAKPVGQRSAHSKPTAQQIRKFNELEKKEENREIRGRSPNSGRAESETVRAPSPK